MKFTYLLALLSLISFVFAQTTLVNTTTTSDLSISASATENVATSTIESTLIPTSSLAPNNSISSTTPSTTSSTSTFNAGSPVQSTGFNPNGNQEASDQESWLKKHNRFVFIIFVGLIILGLLIWYVVRSVKGMRKRLEQENAAQLYMMQQATGYQQQIPESIQTPPPAYKTRENTPVTNNHQ